MVQDQAPRRQTARQRRHGHARPRVRAPASEIQTRYPGLGSRSFERRRPSVCHLTIKRPARRGEHGVELRRRCHHARCPAPIQLQATVRQPGEYLCLACRQIPFIPCASIAVGRRVHQNEQSFSFLGAWLEGVSILRADIDGGLARKPSVGENVFKFSVIII